MCLFPIRNGNIKSSAYKKGLHEFDCGACPECLSKRSRLWALRCSAEAEHTKACMVTLTYDTYKKDYLGNIIGENVDTRELSKKDAQDFLKRLRSYYDNKVKSKIRLEVKRRILFAFKNSPVAKDYKNYRDFRYRYIMRAYKDEVEQYIKDRFEKERIYIKYLLTAERGKKTDRAHYHAILFGIDFAEDRAFYKQSKRGNRIYTSDTLSKIWSHGICTVDCVNVNLKIARYCTKYCAKDSRSAETFMLFSRGIGDEVLLDKFNGKYYMIDGCEYPVPKLIWNKVILNRYQHMHYKYNYYGSVETIYPAYNYKAYDYDKPYISDLNRLQRHYFQALRDSDRQYKEYLEYWNKRAKVFDEIRGSCFERISQLDDTKYFAYKQACFKCFNARNQVVAPISPRSNQRVRFAHDMYKSYRISLLENGEWYVHKEKFALPSSCHTRANDTKKQHTFRNRQIHAFRDTFGEAKIVWLEPALNVISPIFENS